MSARRHKTNYKHVEHSTSHKKRTKYWNRLNWNRLDSSRLICINNIATFIVRNVLKQKQKKNHNQAHIETYHDHIHVYLI